MAVEDEAKPPRGCGRLALWCVLLTLVLAAVFAVFLFTGAPQRMLARYLLASQLDARVEVDAVSLNNPLAVQGLTVAGKAAAHYAPLLHIESTTLAYDWAPRSPRHIRDVSLHGVRLSLQQNETGNNFQFLLDRFAGSGGAETFDITPWLPEQIGVEDLWLETDFPSFYLRLENLELETRLESAERGAIAFGSPETGLAWSSAHAPGGPQSGSGSFAIEARWDGLDADIEGEMDLGKLARARGRASVVQRDGDPYVALFLPSVHLEDPLWSAMLTDLFPVPVRFDALALEDADVHTHREGEAVIVDQASADARLTNFSIGPPEAPYYEGPLQLSVRGNYGDETTILGTMTLLDDISAEGEFQWTPNGLAGTFEWEPWPRTALAALLPADYANVLETLAPLNRLGARGTITQGEDSFDIAGALAPAFGDRAPLDIPVTARYTSTDTGSTFSLTSDVTLDSSRVQTTVTVPADGPVRAENVLTGVDVNRWTGYFFGDPLLDGFGGALSGTAGISVPSGAPLDIALDLTGAGIHYGDIVLPPENPVTMKGQLTYDLDTSRILGKAVHLAQEGFVDLTAPSWSFDLPAATLKTSAEANLSLDALAAIFELAGLYGNAAIRGTLSVGPERTHLNDFAASSEDIGYGDWSVPYGMVLDLAGSLGYVNAANALTLAPVMATIEGTRADADSLAFQFPGEGVEFAMDATGFSLESDLDLLVRRGYLDAVTGGRATIASDNLHWTGDTLDGLATWDIAAETLALPDKMAVLENLTYNGRYNPGDETDGGGQLQAASLAVYDIPFGAVDTQVKVTADRLVVDTLSTTFLGGDLLMSGAVAYLDPAFPGSIDLKVTELDLARFTETFKPPDVILTGKVSGTADMVLSMDGLQDLNVDMTASENLTLNRSMVRQILMSQYVNDAVGSKSVQKVIEKVIGVDDQRPFEAAVLQLRLEDGMIRGIARLESKSLDVTVDINAEPKAILEAIRSSRQGSQ